MVSDDGGGGYNDGRWKTGNKFDMPLLKYSRSDTVLLTNPADWIEWILKDMGVPASAIDTGSGSSFEAAKVVYYSRGIVWNGGFWQKQSREQVLSDLLSMCDSYLYESDKIELYTFSRTSVEFINNTIGTSFNATPNSGTQTDGGKVYWQQTDFPQDVFPGQTDVNLDPDKSSSVSGARSAFIYRFSTDSADAQTAAILFFQKQNIKNRVSLQTSVLALYDFDNLRPGQVVTLYNNKIFRLTIGAILMSMTVNYDLTVNLEAVQLTKMNEWGDLSPTPVSITTDTTSGNMDE
jgi:hypothetical protein